MSEKSFVSQSVAVCPVCTKEHATGILCNQRLRNTLEPKTVTGWEMCPEHRKMKDDGFIALVGIDPDKSDAGLTLSGVWRIGMFAHLRESVWPSIFNVPPPTKKLCFVGKDVLELLEKIPQEA